MPQASLVLRWHSRQLFLCFLFSLFCVLSSGANQSPTIAHPPVSKLCHLQSIRLGTILFKQYCSKISINLNEWGDVLACLSGKIYFSETKESWLVSIRIETIPYFFTRDIAEWCRYPPRYSGNPEQVSLHPPIKVSHCVAFKCESQARDYLSMYQVQFLWRNKNWAGQPFYHLKILLNFFVNITAG